MWTFQRTFICFLLILFACTSQRDWSPLDKILLDAIADKAFPGAVAIVGDSTGILYAKSFGHFTYDTTSPKMTLNVVLFLKKYLQSV